MSKPSLTRPQVVIVVDDDPDVLNSLQFAFEVDGFEVRAFASGEAVLEDGALPDVGCLVIDYRLGGVDGLTLLGRLRERGCRMPAILITTANLGVARKAANANVRIIEKPLLCDTLVGEVRHLLA